MFSIVSKPGLLKKLEILSADAQYDLACACGSSKDQSRRRGAEGKWIYPVTLPNGGHSTLFKTLISNVCTNDCKYCPLREQQDVRRCSLGVEETAKVFLDYYNQQKVFGLFLSSAISGLADNSMERLNAVARLLRNKHKYRGYIHLKVIPGASSAAIEEAVSLSSAVSVNIETPGAEKMAKLSAKKDYMHDIIEPMKLISKLTGRGCRYERVKQTTQFIIGAAGESDSSIVKYMRGLYDRLNMHRVYFSAYQSGLGDESIKSHQDILEPADVFMREHRLYQVDFLFRKYGFGESDIIFDADGNLPLGVDPKQAWAAKHPERFPVNVNTASKFELLTVPGIGPVTAKRILARRKSGRINSVDELCITGARFRKAEKYLTI